MRAGGSMWARIASQAPSSTARTPSASRGSGAAYTSTSWPVVAPSCCEPVPEVRRVAGDGDPHALQEAWAENGGHRGSGSVRGGDAVEVCRVRAAAGGIRGRGWTLRGWISSAGGPKFTTYMIFVHDRSPDEAIARVASRSGGVVDRLQLAALGLETRRDRPPARSRAAAAALPRRVRRRPRGGLAARPARRRAARRRARRRAEPSDRRRPPGGSPLRCRRSSRSRRR